MTLAEEGQVRIKVDDHHPPPIRVGELREFPALGKDPSIEEQHVQTAEAPNPFLEGRQNGFGVRHVALNPKEIRSGRSGFDARVQVQGDDRSAAAHHRFRAGLADPRRRPGHQGDLAGEIRGRAAPPLLGLFQFPVLHLEEFPGRQGPIPAEDRRSQDDFHRMPINVRRHVGILHGPAGRTQPEFRIENHAWRGVDHGEVLFGLRCMREKILFVCPPVCIDTPAQEG